MAVRVGDPGTMLVQSRLSTAHGSTPPLMTPLFVDDGAAPLMPKLCVECGELRMLDFRMMALAASQQEDATRSS